MTTNLLDNDTLTRYITFYRMIVADQSAKYNSQRLRNQIHDKDEYLRNLDLMALFLHLRYKQVQNIEDLNEMILYNEQAVSATPDNHPDLARRLNDLANQLGDKYSRTSNIDDLEASI